ncbi:MAG: alpha amylase N-terminal ig-like domain-containing protein [Clostridium sp.]
MNLEKIIHRYAYTDCYTRNENELVINIRTNKDIIAVNLISQGLILNFI